jgi:hypothetical protein
MFSTWSQAAPAASELPQVFEAGIMVMNQSTVQRCD